MKKGKLDTAFPYEISEIQNTTNCVSMKDEHNVEKPAHSNLWTTEQTPQLIKNQKVINQTSHHQKMLWRSVLFFDPSTKYTLSVYLFFPDIISEITQLDYNCTAVRQQTWQLRPPVPKAASPLLLEREASNKRSDPSKWASEQPSAQGCCLHRQGRLQDPLHRPIRQMLLQLEKLPHEVEIRCHDGSTSFDVSECFQHSQGWALHDVGDGDGGRAWDPSLTVDQHLTSRPGALFCKV